MPFKMDLSCMNPRLAILFGTCASVFLNGCSTTTGSLEDPSPTISASSTASLQTVVDRIQTQVASLRGLSYKRQVYAHWIDRSDLKRYFGSSSGGDSSQVNAFEEALLALGFTRSYGAANQGQSDVTTSGVTAFYLDGTDSLYVVSDQANSSSLSSTIAHELEHALQDQNFGLTDTAQELDNGLAYTCLVEGDAVYLEDLWTTGNPSIATIDINASSWFYDLPHTAAWLQNSMYSDIPLAITIPQLLPYTWGAGMIHAVRSQQEWSGVNNQFLKPPVSTAQILHPELLTKGMTIRDWNPDQKFLSMSAWDTLVTGRFGEAYLATLLYAWGYSPTDSAPMKGWQGDRFWIWRKDTTHHVAAGAVMLEDHPKALAAFAAFASHFPVRYNYSGNTIRTDSTFLFLSTDDSFSASIHLHDNILKMAWGHLGSENLTSLTRELDSLAVQTSALARPATSGRFPRLKPPMRPPTPPISGPWTLHSP
jgi:hypothetical protein